MSVRALESSLRVLLLGLRDQANGMLPVREKSYEAGQRQGLLDVAGQIAEIIRKNAERSSHGKKGRRVALP